MPSPRSLAFTAAAGMFALATGGSAEACAFRFSVPAFVLDAGQTCILDYASGGAALYNLGTIDLRNGGWLGFPAVYNHGSLINNHDAAQLWLTVNEGNITNNKSLQILGPLNSTGFIVNSGTFRLSAPSNPDGSPVNQTLYGSVINQGTFVNDTTQIVNSAAFLNHGTLVNRRFFMNTSTISNFGTLMNDAPAQFMNHGTVAGLGGITNVGMFNNFGTVQTMRASQNMGQFNNVGSFSAITASFLNAGAFTNMGKFQSLLGTVTNIGRFTTFGRFVNEAGTISNIGGFELIGGGRLEGSGNFEQLAGKLRLIDGRIIQDTLTISGGRLEGFGSITADITVDKATVAPGTSPGLLTVNGDIDFLDEAILAIELGGLTAGTEYDRLDVYGSATFQAGATLDISLLGGFSPAFGNAFDILLADDIIIDDLSGLVWNLPMLSGWDWGVSIVDIGNSREALRLTVEADIPEGAAVPLPPTLLLLLGGVLVLAGASVRRH